MVCGKIWVENFFFIFENIQQTLIKLPAKLIKAYHDVNLVRNI